MKNLESKTLRLFLIILIGLLGIVLACGDSDNGTVIGPSSDTIEIPTPDRD